MVRPIALMSRLIRRQRGQEEEDAGGVTLVLPLPTRTTSTTTSTALTTTSATTTSTSSAAATSTSASVSDTETDVETSTNPTTTSTSSSTSSSTSTSTSTSTSSTPTPSTTSESILVVNQSNAVTTSTEVLTPTTTLVIESQTVTTKPQATSPTVPSQAGAAKSSFLENKVASGIVFGLCGLVGLLLILFIIWFAMRKRRRIAKLENEIISFDPTVVNNFSHHSGSDVDRDSINSAEKGHFGRSNSSLDHYAGNGYTSTMNVDSGDHRNAAPYSDYSIQRNGSQHGHGNGRYNPGVTGGYGQPSQTYMLPSQTFNR